jgi:hypothetical protein
MKEVAALSEPWTPKMVEQLIHGRTIFVDNIGKTTPQTLPMIQFDAIALTLNARAAELQADSTSVLTFVDKHRGIVCVNQRRLDYWDSFNASVTHWRELPAAPLVEREG